MPGSRSSWCRCCGSSRVSRATTTLRSVGSTSTEPAAAGSDAAGARRRHPSNHAGEPVQGAVGKAERLDVTHGVLEIVHAEAALPHALADQARGLLDRELRRVAGMRAVDHAGIGLDGAAREPRPQLL